MVAVKTGLVFGGIQRLESNGTSLGTISVSIQGLVGLIIDDLRCLRKPDRQNRAGLVLTIGE